MNILYTKVPDVPSLKMMETLLVSRGIGHSVMAAVFALTWLSECLY